MHSHMIFDRKIIWGAPIFSHMDSDTRCVTFCTSRMGHWSWFLHSCIWTGSMNQIAIEDRTRSNRIPFWLLESSFDGTLPIPPVLGCQMNAGCSDNLGVLGGASFHEFLESETAKARHLAVIISAQPVQFLRKGLSDSYFGIFIYQIVGLRYKNWIKIFEIRSCPRD